jgi:hypothetical protein
LTSVAQLTLLLSDDDDAAILAQLLRLGTVKAVYKGMVAIQATLTGSESRHRARSCSHELD